MFFRGSVAASSLLEQLVTDPARRREDTIPLEGLSVLAKEIQDLENAGRHFVKVSGKERWVVR